MELPASIQPDLVETEAAKEAVLHANTPNYLFHRLRKDTSTNYVANELTTDSILDFVKAVCDKGPKSAVELVHAYIFLTALFLKDDLDRFADRLKSLDMTRLQWGDQFRSIILSEGSPVTFSDVYFAELKPTSTVKTNAKTLKIS